MRNIDWLPFLYALTEPAIQACARTWNCTCDLLVCGMMPNQLSHTSQSYTYNLKNQHNALTVNRKEKERESTLFQSIMARADQAKGSDANRSHRITDT